MRIHLQQQLCPSNRVAKVTLEVVPNLRKGHRSPRIFFTGIVATEARPGYVTLEIPSLESWAESLKQLSTAQRQRFNESRFYRLLQEQISERLCRLSCTSETDALVIDNPVTDDLSEDQSRQSWLDP